MSPVKNLMTNSLPSGVIKQKEDYYMFYNNNGTGDLIIEIITSDNDDELTYRSYWVKPYKIKSVEIETLSGKRMMCYMEKLYSPGEYPVLYEEI